MRVPVYLITESDCLNFCNAACLTESKVVLTNKDGSYRVNAKSILGCLMASREWADGIYVETEEDMYSVFNQWIAETANDSAAIHE